MSHTIRFSIPMATDDEGFFGRECPNEGCLGYFKVKPGTGLRGENLPCHCPYCGTTDSHDKFWTQDQVEFARSVAVRKAQEYVVGALKNAMRPAPPRRGGFLSISWKFKPGAPLPLHRYEEKKLETTLVCDVCGLHYAVYGVFAYCPDCGTHNSLQILFSNLDLASKELELASTLKQPLADQLVSDALENVVGAFDAFGRESLRVATDLATTPAQVPQVSCQNIDRLRARVLKLFGIDVASPFTPDEWSLLVRAFQKRHLIAHKMGVIDQAYVAATRDSDAVVGRKIALDPAEVQAVFPLVRRLGKHVWDELQRKREEQGSA